jgi:hypothetical protein
MTSGDLKSRIRSTIYELDLYLGVRYLHTKAEVSSLIICGDMQVMSKNVQRFDFWTFKMTAILQGQGHLRSYTILHSVPPLGMFV